MEVAGQHFVVRLVESEPGPPVRGDTNVWTLSITDKNGEAAIGVHVQVEPTMPAHGHGTTPAPTVSPVDGQPGTFDVRPLNLFMPGLWQVRIVLSMEADGATLEEEVDFEFWIES